RRGDARPAAHGRTDGVPQGRPSVRGIQRAVRLAPVSGDEPGAARGAAGRILSGTHAVVREDLPRGDRAGCQWRRHGAGPTRMGLQLRSGRDPTLRRLARAIGPAALALAGFAVMALAGSAAAAQPTPGSLPPPVSPTCITSPFGPRVLAGRK